MVESKTMTLYLIYLHVFENTYICTCTQLLWIKSELPKPFCFEYHPLVLQPGIFLMIVGNVELQGSEITGHNPITMANQQTPP